MTQVVRVPRTRRLLVMGAAGIVAGSMAVGAAVVQGAQAPTGAQVQQRSGLESDIMVSSETTGPFVADVAIDSDVLDTRGRRLQPTQRIRYRLSTTDGAEGPSVSVQFTAPPSDPGRGGPPEGLPGFRVLIDPKGVQLFDPQGKALPTPLGNDTHLNPAFARKRWAASECKRSASSAMYKKARSSPADPLAKLIKCLHSAGEVRSRPSAMFAGIETAALWI